MEWNPQRPHTAFELFNTYYDYGNDSLPENADEIMSAAFSDWGMRLPREVADEIMNKIATLNEANEKNGEGENNFYHLFEMPLSNMEIKPEWYLYPGE